MKFFFARHPGIATVCHVVLFALLLVGLDVGFRALYSVPLVYPVSNGRAMGFTLLWSLLFSGVLVLMPTLLRRILSVAIPLFWCLVLLVHGGMFAIFGTFFSFADLSYAGEGAQFFSLSYLHYRKALILLILAVMALSVAAAILVPRVRYRWFQPVIALVLAAAAVGGLYALDASLQESDSEAFVWETVYSSDTDTAVYADFTDTNRCLQMTGNYQYLFRSFLVCSGLADKLSNGSTYEMLDEYYAASTKGDHPDNEMTGAFAGKNAILVLLESIDTWLLTQEYMPNLYALEQAGIQFADHYSPMFISAGTFGTEFTVNTGLIPPTNGINTKAYSTYSFPYSLAHLFENAGYTANSFHSSNPTIYSRGAIHENWGYEAYHSWLQMGMEDYQLDSQMIQGYDQMVSDTPFFSFLLTYSGHGPYTEELSNISDPHLEAAQAAVQSADLPADISDDDYQEYVLAVAHAMETDAFIGELVDALTQDGHIEDTVLIFFTDHYSKYMSNTELVMELKGAENTDLLYQTPFFIYSADTQPQTITKPTSSIDIAPTIANLFDLDVDYTYYPGDDIFGDGGGTVIFPNYNWYDGETYYSSDYEGAVTEEIAATCQTVRTTVNMAWSTLRCNYFAYLSSKQE